MRLTRHEKLFLLFSITFFLQTSIADIQFTFVPNPLKAGERNVFRYNGGDDTKPATILLLKGDSLTPKYILTVTTNALGGSFAWVPYTSLKNGEYYSLQISQDGSGGTAVEVALVGGAPNTTISRDQGPTSTENHPTSTSTKSPTSTSDRSAPQTPSKQGLSTNMVIGVGVGAAVLVIALSIALILLCIKFRKFTAQRRNTPVISKPLYYGSSVELVDNPMFEKDGRRGFRELGTNANRYEIGGSKVRSLRYELG